MESFQDYAYFYNMFYKDKDYKSEAEIVDKLLRKYGNEVESIINFGCGTGRHDMELSELGYQCKGIDLSPLMIDIAKRNSANENYKIDFEVADVKHYNPEKQYNAVISLFHVMSYQNSNQDILDAFRSARKSLTEGGVFIFDTWYGPGVLSDKPSVRVKEVEDEENKLIRIARPVMHDKTCIVDVNYEIIVINKKTDKTKIINETHSMRYFYRPELEILLEQAGFELLDNLDCRTLEETDYESWTSYFIAKLIPTAYNCFHDRK